MWVGRRREAGVAVRVRIEVDGREDELTTSLSEEEDGSAVELERVEAKTVGLSSCGASASGLGNGAWVRAIASGMVRAGRMRKMGRSGIVPGMCGSM